MYVFTPKCGSPILSYKTRHRRELRLIHRQQTIHWIFTERKLSSNYRHKPFVTYWALKKRQALLTI